ncbi:MAG: pre-toxin TG domain-containing protein [Chthonomonadales bacterium]
MPQWQPGSKDRRQISGMLDTIPYIGQAKMGIEALVGRDNVSRTSLSGGNRLFNVGMAMLPVFGKLAEEGGVGAVSAIEGNASGAVSSEIEGAGVYIGQTNNILRRIPENIRSGKLASWEGVQFIPVSGGRLARRIVEQQAINHYRIGVRMDLENEINSIAPMFWKMLGISKK